MMPPEGSLADLPEHDPLQVVFKFKPGIEAQQFLSHQAKAARSTRRGVERLLARAVASESVRVAPLFEMSPQLTEGDRLTLAKSLPGSNEPLADIHLASFTDESAADEVLRELGEDPRIDYAHYATLQYPLGPEGVDPLASKQWYLARCGYSNVWPLLDEMNAPPARIAVIDTGMDRRHPDLPTPFEYESFSLKAEDEVGHGTQVCSILGATRNNGFGVAGALSAALHVFKVFPSSDVRVAYAALKRVSDGPARVLNYSMGSRKKDPTIAELIRACINRNIVVVAAMGNDFYYGNPANAPVYPAAQPGVIAVGATDNRDKRWRHSQTGDHIFLSAPGVDLFTCKPNRSFGLARGTSFATPLVSAAVAMLLRREPALRVKDVRDILQRTADPIKGGWNREYGHGVLNLRRLSPNVS